MRAFADVAAEVDRPEQRAVELVRLEDRRIGDARLRVVLRRRRSGAARSRTGRRRRDRRRTRRSAYSRPASAAGSSDRAARARRPRTITPRCAAVRRRRRRRRRSSSSPDRAARSSRAARCLRYSGSAFSRVAPVVRRGARAEAARIGRAAGRGRRRLAIHVERDAGRIAREQPPAQEHLAVALLHRDEAAIELFQVAQFFFRAGRQRAATSERQRAAASMPHVFMTLPFPQSSSYFQPVRSSTIARFSGVGGVPGCRLEPLDLLHEHGVRLAVEPEAQRDDEAEDHESEAADAA